MAIYSLNVSTVGKSTHAPGTAGAHLRYIAREDAATHVAAEHMPADAQEARTWMDGYERDARANARLLSKVRIALPRELTHEQNAALAQEFVAGLTGGRIPSFLAIHDQGQDAVNPHAHIVLIDRDMQTGKRVLMLSDSPKDRRKAGLPENGVAWIRAQWEHRANAALERAGHEARIDRRSLEAQGLEREPTIHIGPRAQHIDSQVQRPESKAVPAPTPRQPDRVIDYPLIDAGRTRRERNAEIIDLNIERAARSGNFEARVWAQFEREQRAQDRVLENKLIAAARQRTTEQRRVKQGFAAKLAELRSRRDAEGQLAKGWIRQRYAPEAAQLRQRHEGERAALSKRQRGILSRLTALFDITGRSRKTRDEQRQALARKHRDERRAFAARLRDARSVHGGAIRARYAPEKDDLDRARTQALDRLQERHSDALAQEDRLRQAREAEREQARTAIREQVARWKQAQKDKGQETEQAKAEPQLGKEWDRQSEGGRPRDHGGMDDATRQRLEKVREKRRREREQRGKDKGRDRGRDYER